MLRSNGFHLMALSGSCSLLAIASPALAQQTAGGEANVSEQVEQQAPGGEIVVTATRRSETLSKVPLAVTAVNAQSLQNSGASDIRQLGQLAPSLMVSSTGTEANGSARVRGVGTVGDNPGLESSVAVFIDGVYRSRSGVALSELGEVERIEVLRGPQGTLFGRNASAGLIHVISKKPSFTFGANAEASYGNYDYWRLAGSITGPLTDTLAAKIEGVYAKRDGFYDDVNTGTTVNNRDRYFVRGQFLFEPTDATSVRLIGDYTHREEACCGAAYIDAAFNPLIGGLNDPAQNNIVKVLLDLGQQSQAFSDPFSRKIWTSTAHPMGGTINDGGVSLEINHDFGAAKLTSITGYREFKSEQEGDSDYSTVDLLYRAPGSFRQFKTFTQELRLQGSAFDDKLDWLVGGYFADEKLNVDDALRFGSQYGRFAACRIVSGGGLAGFYDPASTGCLSATGRTVVGSFGADIINGFDRLDSIRNVGTTMDSYHQHSKNYAMFTHNIITLADELKLTLGARYTWEDKSLDATFGNNNTICPALQGTLIDDLSSANATVRTLAGSLLSLGCQGNSTSEVNRVSINGKRSESEFTYTAGLSYQVRPEVMIYANYSKGYKAGGFNLDRSALKSPIMPFAAGGGAQAYVHNLMFDPEYVKAYEVGLKYSSREFSLSVTGFRQEFSNFQLNTFAGAVYIVQTVNGCKASLGGADRDADPATGTCANSDVGYGVLSQGVEIEGSLRPARNLTFNLGVTYASTKYRDNLVGNSQGAPLDPALRMLPGKQISNSAPWVVTSSASWSPEIGSSGLHALFYVDARLSSDYNTGSDLYPQKMQDSFVVVNGRIGLRGPDDHWGVEFWVQNLFNQDYTQVTFNTPYQAGGSSASYVYPQFPGGKQLFSSFLAEPRTYGVTLRGKF